MKQEKEGALIGKESDVLSIYICARERDAHFTPPLLAASLIFQNVVSNFNNFLFSAS
jgi:hypothetical protein